MPKQSVEQQPATKLLVEGLVPAVGDGNPEAISSFLFNLRSNFPEATINLTELHQSAWLPKLFHQIMTGSTERSVRYSQNSHDVREGPAARIATKLMAAEIKIRHIQDGNLPKNLLVAVQEMALQGVPPKQLASYDEVFLLIPDVLGKLPPTIPANKREFWQNITVVVWNEYARQILLQSGYNIVLAQPWMYYQVPDLIAAPVYPETNRGTDVYIKTSGSGWPKSWEKHLLSVFNQHGINYSLYLPNNIVVDPNGKRDAMVTRPFYPDFNWHPPQVLIGYPSELIQVLAAHSLENSTPQFYSLPPKGMHELTNLIWAIQNGYCQGMIFPDGYINALPKQIDLPRGITSAFHSPEIALFNTEFINALHPTSTYEDLLLRIINHIPLELAIKNQSFLSHRTNAISKKEQSNALGQLSFFEQLSNRSGTIDPVKSS
ncbi:hypothetical protein KBC89_03705 [Candidatus Woesebacteria bacterium]|nr:hypothetical protein [Candidatus Woesebacteria bacterium]